MAPDLNSMPSSPHIPQNSTRDHDQPNVLFIMADQLAAPLLKMYNPDSQIKTPNLDALAAKSVQFDSAYCPSPLCAPSRMSLITGLLPMKIGAYDNASQISSDWPTYAHSLRAKGYHTALAGKMHFIGDQLHGYETRLTADIYPGDYGWAVNWDDSERRLEWYHNASSILQAGTCVRSNQLDYDEEVMYKSKQFLYDQIREGPNKRPFCLTVSLTHPHDPYTIEEKYWDLYEDVDIDLPKVSIPKEEQDAHSKRLLKVCDLWDENFTDEQIKRARRAYYGAVSYVDDCIGRLLQTLKQCRLDKNTIVVFSGDHGDMLGERGLWYKMNYFEGSARVPLLISDPTRFEPHRVKQNVSTLDIPATLCDLVGTKPFQGLPMDGSSLLPHLEGREGHDTVIAEYTGEGTISPLMMIRRGPWKYITCPTDAPQLYNLEQDPLELVNLAQLVDKESLSPGEEDAKDKFLKFEAEAKARWNFETITEEVLLSQRKRRFVWEALKVGRFDSWDFDPAKHEDGTAKYIRSFLPLDDLERKARFPIVDKYGRETGSKLLRPTTTTMASLNISQEELKAVEQTRQRLFQLSNSIGSLKTDVFNSNPLPSLESLQASADILQQNMRSLLSVISNNEELFTQLAIHPSTNFPGRTQENILLQLLRKKPEPDDLSPMNQRWASLDAYIGKRAQRFIEEEFPEDFTAEELDQGIENVRTGLRRKFEEYEEEDDEEEGGGGAKIAAGMKNEDDEDDVTMIDRPPPPPPAVPSLQSQASQSGTAPGHAEGLNLDNMLKIATLGSLAK
ncbi:choline sulfatase [Truncatella angustata]|uniref:Choline sulfatase n=1 Tax=Truncatella angustata TaxID=152316 RepID=A0A9P9A1L7_9PEZI|nr:choline sulfatase [Truncatella angustata]KAH6657291.1 choline sulfatase [Truncatella angustata]